ncbi:MAG: hypothetical protein ABI680_12510 [Chthoniobacteraceae bacterium]
MKKPEWTNHIPSQIVMVDSFFKWVAYFAVVSGVIYLGWREPLRYRFMSRAEINKLEHPVVPTPRPQRVVEAKPTPVHWMWDENKKTLLEKDPYNRTYGRGKSQSGPYTYPR